MFTEVSVAGQKTFCDKCTHGSYLQAVGVCLQKLKVFSKTSQIAKKKLPSVLKINICGSKPEDVYFTNNAH